ncbi:MAG: hypothetical protein J6A37_05020 [Oscillospiraceae bacterium]|nr:hypothetical protein [Oscillospiraceae bacterium]
MAKSLICAVLSQIQIVICVVSGLIFFLICVKNPRKEIPAEQKRSGHKEANPEKRSFLLRIFLYL